MFRKLAKNKKAQNTAEYAILISLVVAGIIAMQTYAQRALQARVHDASVFMKNETSELGKTLQYEPYYLKSQYTVVRNEDEGQVLGKNITSQLVNSQTTREAGGSQVQVFCKATDGLNDK